jgi:hypothetical protein
LIPIGASGRPVASPPLNACFGANHLQTNHADFGGTGRHRTARTPNRAARNGSTRNRRHEPTGLITQRSLVQIQPAQRSRCSQGVSEGSGTPSCLQIVLNNPARVPRHRRRKPLFNGLILFPILRGRDPEVHPGSRRNPRQRAFSAPAARVYKPFANAPGGPRAWYGLECPGGRSKWTTSP